MFNISEMERAISQMEIWSNNRKDSR